MRTQLRETHTDFGGLLRDIVAAESAHDRRLWNPRLKFEAVSGAHEAGGAEGGFLIPDTLAEEMWSRVYATGRILSRCDRQPVTRGDGIKLPAISETSRANGSRFGGVRMHWAAEAAAVAATKPEFVQLALKLKKLLGFAYATDELLEDYTALAAVLRRLFAAEATFTIEDGIVNGSGAGTPLGVLKSPALITVAKEGSQEADTVMPANIAKMAGRLWGPSHRSAIWMMSNDVYGQLVQQSFDDGAPVVVHGEDGPTILSMPVELGEYTQQLGNAGDILLADFGQYIVAEKQADFISSIHVKFIEDETAFKFRYRVDGQPAWATAITPRNSAITQSPFVTLAERA